MKVADVASRIKQEAFIRSVLIADLLIDLDDSPRLRFTMERRDSIPRSS